MPKIQITPTTIIDTDAISFLKYCKAEHEKVPKRQSGYGQVVSERSQSSTISDSILEIHLNGTGPLPKITGTEADRVHGLIDPHMPKEATK